MNIKTFILIENNVLNWFANIGTRKTKVKILINSHVFVGQI